MQCLRRPAAYQFRARKRITCAVINSNLVKRYDSSKTSIGFADAPTDGGLQMNTMVCVNDEEQMTQASADHVQWYDNEKTQLGVDEPTPTYLTTFHDTSRN